MPVRHTVEVLGQPREEEEAENQAAVDNLARPAAKRRLFGAIFAQKTLLGRFRRVDEREKPAERQVRCRNDAAPIGIADFAALPSTI